MGGLPWYPLYPGDYARDTKQLSLIEHGAYRLLMDYYYSNGSLDCGITIGTTYGQPNVQLMPDHTRYYRICGAIQKDEMSAVDFILGTFFVYLEGIYTHNKIEKVIKEQLEKHDKRVAASLAGVEARENKKKGKGKGRTKRITNGQTIGITIGTTNQNQNQNQLSIDKSILLKPQNVSEMVWSDFLAQRKAKRAKLSQTALDGIAKQAKLAGWTLEAALQEVCARGWTGFKAEWVAKQGKPSMKITGNEDYNDPRGTEGFIVE